MKAGGGKRVQSICFESLTFLREGACNPSEGRLFLVSDILPVPLISGSGLLLGLRATKLFGALLKLAPMLLKPAKSLAIKLGDSGIANPKLEVSATSLAEAG